MSILIENLTHIYHENTALQTTALEGISLSIERSHWTSIIGHTGSGKSTLAQHLNAILRPTSGRVVVDGTAVVPAKENKKADFRQVRKRVGLVFQYPEQQLFEETVREEIAFAPRNWGIPEGQLDSVVLSSLHAVGLDDSYLNRNPFSLSGGEKRRVAIASVLAASPDYLVLDEPTAGLDWKGREALLSLLARIYRNGTGIVLITHDLEIAFAQSDRILALDHGRMVSCGTSEEMARFLWTHPVQGLVLPEMYRLELSLLERGIKVPLTCDPVRLSEALVRARRKSR
ncbi:MAG: ATP-binding cassette domain-containing protein [Pyramidobacter sp.]|nr:ATP-binding cassette domain-containing protein [Pyramidobacter sp.]